MPSRFTVMKPLKQKACAAFSPGKKVKDTWKRRSKQASCPEPLVCVQRHPILNNSTRPITHWESRRRHRWISLELLATKRHARVAAVPRNDLAFESGNTKVDEAAAVCCRGDAGDTAVVGRVAGDEGGAVAVPAIDFGD